MVKMKVMLFTLVLVCAVCGAPKKVKHPVILVPGDGGNQLEAKLDKPAVVDNMRLQYNNMTRQTSNSPGVSIRVPGFGNTSTVEWLDPDNKVAIGSYFHNIAEMLVSQLGYQRGHDLLGAPLDFRKAPNELQEYFSSLRSLIENAVNSSGKRAVLMTHSMGGPVTLTFLQQQTQNWKDKYVRSLVTLAAPWAGSVKLLKVFAVGDNLGVFVLSEGTLRDEQRTNPSSAWLLPSKYFWKPNETLVYTPERNYTVLEMENFLSDISWPIGWEMRKDTEKYALDLTAPGVEVYCIYGSAVPTLGALKYAKGKFPDGYPDFVMDNGDGTVNLRSLEGCIHWSPKGHRATLNAGHQVYHQAFPGLDHMDTLRHGRIVEYIRQLFAQKINN